MFQMSSNNNGKSVSTHIPILDGANYREWAPQIEAYLQFKGYWHVANGQITHPADGDTAQPAWDITDNMAKGNIVLWMSTNIYNQV